jgi:hypothetical protein
MWKKLVGIAAISLATTIAPGMLTAAAQDNQQTLCPVPGPSNGDFDQQGDWEGQNVTLVPCGTA